MEPEIQSLARADLPAGTGANETSSHEPADPDLHPHRNPDWFLIGDQGLRAGWAVAFFVILYRLFVLILGALAVSLYPAVGEYGFSLATALVSELVLFLALLGAAALVALFEQRRIVEYNLTGPRRPLNFFSGVAAGFLALSALVGMLAWGGWLRFVSGTLTWTGVVKFGALWGCAFLLVGCVEEGIFRCFLQFTLTRGINFWWALGIVAVVCLDLLLRSRGYPGVIAFLWMESPHAITGSGMWGVFAVALLGLLPCFVLHQKNAARSAFWQAAWVTSTLFGFVHTGNHGENWIGIFAAAAIGFVFCVSVWVTGSAWWAIGCHAAWDWAETFFYGTADSGFASRRHFLTTNPAGNALWSGGADGPEGSLLVLAAILLLLAALLAIYGPKRAAAPDPSGPGAGRGLAEG